MQHQSQGTADLQFIDRRCSGLDTALSQTAAKLDDNIHAMREHVDKGVEQTSAVTSGLKEQVDEGFRNTTTLVSQLKEQVESCFQYTDVLAEVDTALCIVYYKCLKKQYKQVQVCLEGTGSPASLCTSCKFAHAYKLNLWHARLMRIPHQAHDNNYNTRKFVQQCASRHLVNGNRLNCIELVLLCMSCLKLKKQVFKSHKSTTGTVWHFSRHPCLCCKNRLLQA